MCLCICFVCVIFCFVLFLNCSFYYLKCHVFLCNCKTCITLSMFSHRGAVLCRRSLRVTCPGHSVSAETVKKLNAVCDTLKDSAAALRQHSYKTHAAETTLEQANTLRFDPFIGHIKFFKWSIICSRSGIIKRGGVFSGLNPSWKTFYLLH